MWKILLIIEVHYVLNYLMYVPSSYATYFPWFSLLCLWMDVSAQLSDIISVRFKVLHDGLSGFTFSCRESGSQREVLCRHRQRHGGWRVSSVWLPAQEISSTFPTTHPQVHFLHQKYVLSECDLRAFVLWCLLSHCRRTLGPRIAPCCWGEFRGWWMKKIFRTI